MIVPSFIDIIAILLGIFLAIRRSDVRAEDPQRHPRVSLQDFERWRARTLAAYSIGTRACFARVIADFAFLAYLHRHPLDVWVARSVGISFEIAWIAALIWSYVARRSARKLGDSLGIRLGGVSAAPPAPESTPDK